MRYDATIAIMDDQPDSQGEILSGDAMLPHSAVLVRMDTYRDKAVGMAWTYMENNMIKASITLHDSWLPPQVAEHCHAVVRGQVLERDGHVIKKWRLSEVLLTIYPADKRLPKLKRCKESLPVQGDFER